MGQHQNSTSQPIQHVYRGPGLQTERPLCCAKPDADLVRVPTIADLVPVMEIMSRDVICARRDLAVELVPNLMVQNRIGCLPVVDEIGRPIGMITKLDLVEELLAEGRRLGARPITVSELMMPLAITLCEHATIAHAAALMASDDVHHIPIVDDDGRMIGIVSTLDIVRWLAVNDGFGTIDHALLAPAY